MRVRAIVAVVILAAVGSEAYGQAPPPIQQPLPPSATTVQRVPSALGYGTPATSSHGRDAAINTFSGGSQKPDVTLPYATSAPFGTRLAPAQR
jgi:hypothetical protein